MTRRPPIAAAILTGLGVLLGLLLSALAPLVLYVVVDRAYGQAPLEYFRLILGTTVQQLFVAWIVFSVWIAVWFGFLMPVRARLRFGQVLGRSVLGLVTGAVVASGVSWVIGSVGQAPVYSPLGEIREDLRAIVGVASTLVFDAVFLVPLAGMVLWAYLSRSRDSVSAPSTPVIEETPA